MEYMIVSTRNGYVKTPAGLDSAFTMNIADAHVFTNFDEAKLHADVLNSTIWQRPAGGKWAPHYTPHNTYNPDTVTQIRRRLYATD